MEEASVLVQHVPGTGALKLILPPAKSVICEQVLGPPSARPQSSFLALRLSSAARLRKEEFSDPMGQSKILFSFMPQHLAVL